MGIIIVARVFGIILRTYNKRTSHINIMIYTYFCVKLKLLMFFKFNSRTLGVIFIQIKALQIFLHLYIFGSVSIITVGWIKSVLILHHLSKQCLKK